MCEVEAAVRFGREITGNCREKPGRGSNAMLFDELDENDPEIFFGAAPMSKMPNGGSPQPVNPGFGMSGRPPGAPRPGMRPQTSYGRPLDFNGSQRAPQSLRGSRADALLPARVPR